MKHEMQIKNRLGKQKFRLLYSDKDIETRVKSLADEINKDFQGSSSLTIIGVLKGSFIFIADLVRHLNIPIHVEFITASSYLKTESSGSVKITEESLSNLKSKDVLIVEDIIDSGLTIQKLVNFIKTKEPSSIRVCSFLMKPHKIKEAISNIDYVGFKLSDGFVVGYGLDYDQNYRELPHIIELIDVNL